MEQELKRIKKLYGEKMARFCRDNFCIILEEENKMLELLVSNFAPNHALYEDIKKHKLECDLKKYIFGLISLDKEEEIIVSKTPEELMSEAGYDLYECKMEEEIQGFKKYYSKEEELCTFNGGRLNRCRVFFAVKKNVDEIKRENFSNPQRQDEYGTSVISIQFTKDGTNTLSIKNRYNHTVGNPDATFSNNLDNIIEGLTKSFEQHYGIIQKYSNSDFEIPSYVRANDGKFYKYNYEMCNLYYCPDNIIIDNFEVKKYPKEKYIVFDYFILDLVNKEVRKYDANPLSDGFEKTIKNIEKIEIKSLGMTKEIKFIVKDGESIILTLDKENCIIGYKNSNLKCIGNNFLTFNKKLSELELNSLEKVGNDFCMYNEFLKRLKLPNLKFVGNNFLYYNRILEELELPQVFRIDSNFCFCNARLKKIAFPQLGFVENSFFYNNDSLEEIELFGIIRIGDNFCKNNMKLKYISFENVEKIGKYFLYSNENLTDISCPKLKLIEDCFLNSNKEITSLDFPNLISAGDFFMYHNTKITSINLPLLQQAAIGFMGKNQGLTELNMLNLKSAAYGFLEENTSIKKINLPKLEIVSSDFLSKNRNPKVLKIKFQQRLKRMFS